MKVPLAQRSYSPVRSLETLEGDYRAFQADGGNIKRVKHYNNMLGLPFFNIPLDQASVTNIMEASTYKHYTLYRLLYRHFISVWEYSTGSSVF